MKRQEAPGSMEMVRQFINTWDLELGRDALDTPAGLRGWLLEQDLIAAGEPVDDGARRRAVEVRESLRALAATHSGQPMPPGAARVLDDLAADAVVRLRFRADGSQELAPLGGAPVYAALGRLLAVVGRGAADGSWQRLKVCPAEDCRWAFYDHSKNRSGLWCQMAECGNRTKARAYRSRRQSGAPGARATGPAAQGTADAGTPARPAVGRAADVRGPVTGPVAGAGTAPDR
ncbi:CGNR zinc finger domain-containing protein [Streptomyces polygonati]|uniref:CGNR zinc finger domain-containing protein n=1 Tax=Streptomyces polygonati TaxID=1617087 RepID=A0ABV8HD49_9ACTN